MNKISYHLILVNSSLRVLIDQLEQLCQCIKQQVDGNPTSERLRDRQLPSFATSTQRLNHPLTTPGLSGKRENENMNKIMTGCDRPGHEKSILDLVYGSIKRSPKGIAFVKIQKKTGLGRKQIANAVYKLKKRNLIKAKRRGIYVRNSTALN